MGLLFRKHRAAFVIAPPPPAALCYYWAPGAARSQILRILLPSAAIMTEIVCPGKRLGRVSEFRAGPGTYVRGSYIYASVVGPKMEQAAADEDGKPFIVVSAASL